MSGTISTPFVFLKARGSNSIPTKKAQLPSNIKTLFKICNRLFQKYGEVKTIYNADGVVIKDISEVPPGATLYVSNREANENETLASKQGIFALGRPPESPDESNKSNKIESNNSYKALFGQKDGVKNENQVVFRSRDQKLQNESQRRNQEKQNQINKSLEREKKKQEDKRKQVEERKRLQEEKRRQQEEEEERRRRQQEEEEERRRLQQEEDEENERQRLEYEENERRRQQEEDEENERRSRKSEDDKKRNQDVDYDYDEDVENNEVQEDERSKRSFGLQDLSINDRSRRSSGLQASNSPRNSSKGSSRNSPRNSSRSSPRNKDGNEDLSESFDSTFDPQMFTELLTQILDNDELNDTAADELENSEKWMKKFLGLAPQFEKDQMSNWYDGLYSALTQIGIPVSFLGKPVKKSGKTAGSNNGYDVELYGIDQILSYVRNTIVRHRFVSSQNYVDYNFNIAIIGPRNSGKSNLLTCFASEIMKELSATDNWRKFFIFPMNFKVFAPFYNDISSFYATMVDMVVIFLCWQSPFYSQHAMAIKRLLMSAINIQMVGSSSTNSVSKSQQQKKNISSTNSPTRGDSRTPPVVSKSSLFYRDVPHFAISIQKVAQEIYNVWNEPGSLSQFLTLIYSLPSLVSSLAGFSKVIYFIDNIEYADVEIVPMSPFNSEGESQVVYNIEVLQYVISGQNFVLTGEDQKKLFECLSPVEENTINLESRIDFVSTIGIIPNDENDNRLIRTEIQNEPLPFSFTIDACCGVPAFLQMWVELNDEFDAYEDDNNDNGEGGKEDDFMLLVTHAQQVIDVLFTFDDKSPLFVTNVKRSAKEADQQSQS